MSKQLNITNDEYDMVLKGLSLLNSDAFERSDSLLDSAEEQEIGTFIKKVREQGDNPPPRGKVQIMIEVDGYADEVMNVCTNLMSIEVEVKIIEWPRYDRGKEPEYIPEFIALVKERRVLELCYGTVDTTPADLVKIQKQYDKRIAGNE